MRLNIKFLTHKRTDFTISKAFLGFPEYNLTLITQSDVIVD